MTQPVDPQPPEIPRSATKDQVELLRFLREESEANRKAQREESDANRKLFLDTSKVVAIPLAVLLTLSGIFFYHDVNTMKEAMKAQGEESARIEIQKMDKHIDETLESQFKTETIQKTIQQAAEVATREQAPGLIKEVITPEVKRAVASQSATIKEVATRAATDEVKIAIDPVVADVKLQALIAKANADDARAFDELLGLRSTGSTSQKDLVNGVIVNLQRHAADGTAADRTSYYYECANPGGTAYQALLTSPLVAVRKNAIADCIAYMEMGQWVPKVPGDSVSAFTVIETVAPMWIKIAFGDPSLSVRAEAITGLNRLFKGSPNVPLNGFDLLDTTFLRQWWAKNASNQAALALVAFAYGGPPMQQVDRRIDQIGLYDEAQRLAKISPQPLASELEQLRERMRSVAATDKPSPSELAKQMGRDCAGVQQDFGIRLQTYRNKPEDERVENYGLLEMQYLETACTVQGQLLTQIAEYGISTRSLNRRYAAIEIVNKASGMSLDPYDSKPLEGWLKTHNDKSGH
jgi:hypothetical protein